MLRGLAQIISAITHPLLILTYVLILLLQINPYLFGVNSISEQVPLILLIFMSTFTIPVIAVVMMKFLGLVSTFSLEDKRERIGPYIITGIFYLWLFINFNHDQRIPIAYTSFVLGATIGLFLAFFINNFSKISAHAVGMGGLVAMLLIIMFTFNYHSFSINIGSLGLLQMSMSTLFVLTILLTGLVGSARLLLEAHSLQDLYGGFIVGFASQFIALRFLL